MRLNLGDVDLEDGSILVEGKRRKHRTVYLTESGAAYIRRWLEARCDAAGPLFNPVRQSGEIPVKRLGGESNHLYPQAASGAGRRRQLLTA